jgi:hypothetical protein
MSKELDGTSISSTNVNREMERKLKRQSIAIGDTRRLHSASADDLHALRRQHTSQTTDDIDSYARRRMTPAAAAAIAATADFSSPATVLAQLPQPSSSSSSSSTTTNNTNTTSRNSRPSSKRRSNNSNSSSGKLSKSVTLPNKKSSSMHNLSASSGAPPSSSSSTNSSSSHHHHHHHRHKNSSSSSTAAATPAHSSGSQTARSSSTAATAVDVTGSLLVAASKSNDPDELVRVARAMVGVDNVAAEACFTRALALNPAHTKALATFAIFCETIVRDFDRAETLYKNAAFSGQPIHLQNYAEFLKNIRKNDAMAAKLTAAANEAKQRSTATASLVAFGARPPPPAKQLDSSPPRDASTSPPVSTSVPTSPIPKLPRSGSASSVTFADAPVSPRSHKSSSSRRRKSANPSSPRGASSSSSTTRAGESPPLSSSSPRSTHKSRK